MQSAMVISPQKKLPKPLPMIVACLRCGYDTDKDGYCVFCGAVNSQNRQNPR